MNIFGIEVSVVKDTDKKRCSAMQFAALMTSGSIDEYKKCLADVNIQGDSTQIFIPEEFFLNPLNSYIAKESGTTDIESGKEEQCTIMHMIAGAMLGSIDNTNIADWESRLDFLMKNGADINAISDLGHTPLNYIQNLWDMFADDISQMHKVEALFIARGAFANPAAVNARHASDALPKLRADMEALTAQLGVFAKKEESKHHHHHHHHHDANVIKATHHKK